MVDNIFSYKETFLEREVDRKEFILVIIAIALAVTGISGMLKRLSTSLPDTKTDAPATAGFGKGAYGI